MYTNVTYIYIHVFWCENNDIVEPFGKIMCLAKKACEKAPLLRRPMTYDFLGKHIDTSNHSIVFQYLNVLEIQALGQYFKERASPGDISNVKTLHCALDGGSPTSAASKRLCALLNS